MFSDKILLKNVELAKLSIVTSPLKVEPRRQQVYDIIIMNQSTIMKDDFAVINIIERVVSWCTGTQRE